MIEDPDFVFVGISVAFAIMYFAISNQATTND